jgi:hypothetical protein
MSNGNTDKGLLHRLINDHAINHNEQILAVLSSVANSDQLYNEAEHHFICQPMKKRVLSTLTGIADLA